MSEPKPEGEEAYLLAKKMLSEPMILVASFTIFLICIVAFEWKTIWDAVLRLLG